MRIVLQRRNTSFIQPLSDGPFEETGEEASLDVKIDEESKDWKLIRVSLGTNLSTEGFGNRQLR